MRNRFLALEEADQPTPLSADEQEAKFDMAHVEFHAERAASQQEQEQLSECQEISDTVGALTKSVGLDLGVDTALTPKEAKILEVAVEHFRTRLGYAKRVMPAMESFGVNPKASTLEVVGNMRAMQALLDKKLKVSQEGFINRVRNAWERMFTHSHEVALVLPQLIERIGQYGIKDTIHADPAWARIFSDGSGQQIDGSHVLKVIGQVKANITRLIPLVEEAVVSLDKIILAVSKSSVSISGEDTAAIYQLGEKLTQHQVAVASMHTNLRKGPVLAIPAPSAKVLMEIGEEAVALVKINQLDQLGHACERSMSALDNIIDQITVSIDDDGQTTQRHNDATAAVADAVSETLYQIQGLVTHQAHMEWLVAYGAYKLLKCSVL